MAGGAGGSTRVTTPPEAVLRWPASPRWVRILRVVMLALLLPLWIVCGLEWAGIVSLGQYRPDRTFILVSALILLQLSGLFRERGRGWAMALSLVLACGILVYLSRTH